MIDDATLVEWERHLARNKSSEPALDWLLEAITEIRRLREEKSDLAAHLEDTVDPECRRLLDGALTNLAAHQAVVPEAYGAMLDLQAVLDHGGPTSEAERTALRSRIAKLEALVVAARTEGRG